MITVNRSIPKVKKRNFIITAQFRIKAKFLAEAELEVIEWMKIALDNLQLKKGDAVIVSRESLG